MGLRDVAAADFQRFHEDSVGGFGWPITLIAPDGSEYPVTGFSTDTNLQIDPQTGQTVSGRAVAVSVTLRTLAAAGIADWPYGVTRKGERPWTVRLDDITGETHVMKVAESHPDRAIGSLVMRLEGYVDG